MSISAALSNAVSGLNAVSRSAEVVSANISNALTEGYGRRELALGAAVVGGQGAGVTVVGIERIVNESALADRRLSDAALGFHEARATLLSDIERTIGSPDLPGSLSAHMARFDQSIIVAAGDPSSDSKLSNVLDAADGLATKFNSISNRLQSERQKIDASIGSMVTQLNRSLEDVDALNRQIKHQLVSGGTAAGLMDQRQQAVDRISELIPIQSVQREYGQIALITPNGTTLVDYAPARFEFTETSVITPDLTLGGGGLSGLTLDGTSSSNGNALESISGGALGAAFTLRDEVIPDIQENIDGLALDLADRSTGADTTLLPGMAGLFTDHSGGTPILTDVTGLAGRIRVNATVNPSEGGQLWRIRDGIGASGMGNASDRTLLNSISVAIAADRLPAAGSFQTSGSAPDLISEVLSQVGQQRQTSLARQSFHAAQSQAFRELESEGGVDTDQEMQKLLLIEQSFAANAKVIQAIDEMLQSLLRI